jgi:hypothetical protein
MLEYDIAFPTSKKHRDFLWEKSKFREILPISSEELKAKIHQTYRLQYVQVCASLLIKGSFTVKV